MKHPGSISTTALLITLITGTALAQRPVTTEAGRSTGAVGPSPSGLAVTGTPAQATVSWQPTLGASGYSVQRWKQSDPNCCRAQSVTLPATVSSWNDLVQWSGTWVYRVTALYPNSATGFADVTYLYPEPQIPAGFKAVQTGEGKVVLSWTGVPDASYYVVSGPPTNQPVRVSGVTTTLTGVPPGPQTWQLGSIYDPDQVHRAGSAFTPASVTVVRRSGRYLVTMTGVRAISGSFDDQLSRDGKGDEVYAAAYVRRYDRATGVAAEVIYRRTLTYGDVNGFGTTRVQAGTSSASGGIRDTDPIPANSDPTQRLLPPSDIAFPLRLWEGTLTDGGDVLVLSPTLWEEDGMNQQYLNWAQQMASITPSLFARPEMQTQLAQGGFGQLLFGTSLLRDGTADAAHFVLSLFSGAAVVGEQARLLFEGGTDRGIGILRSGLNDLVLPNVMVVLTRESIEAGLAPLPPGTQPVGLPMAWPRMPQPGVIMVPLVDGNHKFGLIDLRPARYELYLKVERLP